MDTKNVHDNVLEAIGNTPLVRLNKVTAGIDSTIYGKLEFMNPGSSIKDRVAVKILEAAKARGELKPGSTIVEATSGNTGMGLALYGAVNGYKVILVMPDKVSEEKQRSLQALGATVVICPTNVMPDDPRSYYSVTKKIVAETPNSFHSNQYANPDNPLAHYETTGPEIWNQLEGKVDAVVCCTGTGGTISGIGKYLKEQNKKIKIIGVDPIGSIIYDHFKTGTVVEAHSYLVEGFGEDFIPEATDFSVIDDIIQVNDKESFEVGRALARSEGIFAGGSSGSAVCGALKYARTLSKPETIVVILADSGSRYLGKMYNDEWMKTNHFI